VYIAAADHGDELGSAADCFQRPSLLLEITATHHRTGELKVRIRVLHESPSGCQTESPVDLEPGKRAIVVHGLVVDLVNIDVFEINNRITSQLSILSSVEGYIGLIQIDVATAIHSPTAIELKHPRRRIDHTGARVAIGMTLEIDRG